MDYSGGLNVITRSLYVRIRGEFEDAVMLAVRTEEGAVSEGIQAACRFPPRASRRNAAI